MKTPRMHCLPRSVAHSAAAAVISLAAALTAAAPAAADNAAPPEVSARQEKCEVSAKQNQGLEGILLALLPLNMGAMKQEDQCDAHPDGQSEGGRSWFDRDQKAGADNGTSDGARSEESAQGH
ncbi:hypothetical protein [Streptomyces sp. NPDC001480]|uniref:hypothetical protein n=1 Tax=Streptomyces sp. NPDC001480 TaxID=3364577 RepID=UPI003688F774